MGIDVDIDIDIDRYKQMAVSVYWGSSNLTMLLPDLRGCSNNAFIGAGFKIIFHVYSEANEAL